MLASPVNRRPVFRPFDLRILAPGAIGLGLFTPAYYEIGQAVGVARSFIETLQLTLGATTLVLIGYQFYFSIQRLTLKRKRSPKLMESSWDRKIKLHAEWVWIYG